MKGGWLFFGFPGYACRQVNTTRGIRPYELDWVGRYEDDHIPMINFDKEEKWTVDVSDGSAETSLSQEQMIWEDYTYKVTYSAKNKDVSFIIR